MRDTRDRMIHSTAELMRRRGVAGTSFTDVLESSGATRGVIYHHFPGGKDELARAAVTWTGSSVEGYLEALHPSEPTAAGVARAFFDLVRPIVAESAAGAGCAVAAAATESLDGSPLQMASKDALRSWRAALVDQLAANGLSHDAAQGLASLLIATLEGAHVLCRAESSITPFDELTAALAPLIAAAPAR